MSDSLEELGKELAKLREKEEEFVCDICGLVYDSEVELELHFWNAHREYLEEVENKAEELSENEEIRRKIEEYKENLKKKILLESKPRQVKAYEQNPEELEERVEKEMLMSALKEKADSSNESQLLIGLKDKMKTEAEDTFLRRGICSVCHEQFGNWEELQKHIKAQVESGSLEHKKLDDYIKVAMTEDMEKIKTYYEGYPKYQYYPPYEEKYPYVCPICARRFPSKEAFLVHWSSEHQMRYGTYKEFTSKENLAKEEDKRKKELIFIAESLLRKRRKD
jgi:hypothetical protein